MVPLRFIRALYCVGPSLQPLQGRRRRSAGARPTPPAPSSSAAPIPSFQATGFSDHPYPQGRIPPNVPMPNQPDYADLPAIPKLERTLDQLQNRVRVAQALPY